MLLAALALMLASPAGFIGLHIQRGIVALLIGSTLHGIEASGFVFKRAFSAPGSLLITMVSADSLYRSPGKGSPQVRTRCFTAHPPHLPPRRNRMTSLCCASSSGRVGLSMRFLFIGSPLSHSLPSHGRLPSQSWLLVVISIMFSCFGSLTGDFHPICNAPMLGAHKALQSNRSGRSRLVRDPRLSSPRAVAELGRSPNERSLPTDRR